MSRRGKIMVIAAPPILLYLILSGMLNPDRWESGYLKWHETVPISFYGRVSDTKGQPVAGAKVEMKRFTFNPLFVFGAYNAGAEMHSTAETDQDGRFKVEGVRGSMLIIENVKKTGYEFRPPIAGGGYWDTGYYYAGVGANPPHRPDPMRPVVFQMERVTDK
jgi:hypothetical protein